MKKKIILLIGLIILTSGCDAEYTLELNSNKFNEIMAIHNYNKNSWSNENPTYKSLIEQALISSFATDYREEKPETNDKQEGVNYYNLEKISTNNDLGLRFQSKFNIEEYSYSTLVFSNTEFFKYSYNKDKITINSGDKIKAFINYPKLNNLTIKFITNHEVINNNADEIKDGIYYWHLNKNDSNNKKIELEISTKYNERKLEALELDENGYFGGNTLVIFYLIGLIILVIIGGTIFFKVKNSNK